MWTNLYGLLNLLRSKQLKSDRDTLNIGGLAANIKESHKEDT
jgi:hypothetical protein